MRGSQNSLNRPTPELNQNRDRPISAYIPQGQQPTGYPGNQLQHQGPPPRSQSSRDIIRQEAKLQEMQEEVRRRELRGAPPTTLNQYRPSTYNVRPMTAAQTANAIRPSRPIGSTPNLGPTSPTYNTRPMGPNYGYTDPQYNQYGQFNKHPQAPPNHYGMIPKGKNEPIRAHPGMDPGRSGDYGADSNRQVMEHNRQFGSGSLNSPQYTNGPSDPRNGQFPTENPMTRPQNGDGNILVNPESLPPTRPMLPEEGYRESPPPLNTSTHPLYSKPQDAARYTASMQDPPRGGYYPAPGAAQQQQTRQYQYSATNPWQREEREKEQARRREAARLWRDQQIAELSSQPQRTSQQEEQLRALQLERDFQKRAEEAANQQDDDDESNDLENESAARVQGLLRLAATQDRNNQLNQQQQHNLMRANANNQSIRGTLSPQPVGSQLQSTSVPLHTATSQQGPHGPVNSYGQNEGHSQQMQNQNNPAQQQQSPMTPTYGTTIAQQLTNPKGAQANEERERQRRIDELKKIQAEFDENQRKREEEIRQQQQQLQLHQQQMQQLYAQQQQHQQQQLQSNLKSQQQLHPGMLRLDNLVINGPSSPPCKLIDKNFYTLVRGLHSLDAEKGYFHEFFLIGLYYRY